jgi:hypothetical protein
MAGNNLKLLTGAVALLLSAPGHAQNDGAAAEGVERCRTIADTVERLACYDNIGKRKAATAPVPEVQESSTPDPVTMEERPQDPEQPPEVASEDSAYGELKDDVGLPKSADEYKPIPVNVVRCGQASDYKWYFYFDNGQVWQYLGARTLRYRSCDTPGTLVEDGMGFALKMDGDKAKLRVKRVR